VPLCLCASVVIILASALQGDSWWASRYRKSSFRPKVIVTVSFFRVGGIANILIQWRATSYNSGHPCLVCGLWGQACAVSTAIQSQDGFGHAIVWHSTAVSRSALGMNTPHGVRGRRGSPQAGQTVGIVAIIGSLGSRDHAGKVVTFPGRTIPTMPCNSLHNEPVPTFPPSTPPGGEL